MMEIMFFIINVLLLIYCNVCFGSIQKRSNFVLVLTDDQDAVLNGMVPMVKTKKLVQDTGVEFTNAFVSTPLCCPSRASILTGCYAHNHGVVNNSVEGNCNSVNWQNGYERKTFAVHLKGGNYTTFYAGKYLNKYGNHHVGGIKYIPPGWDWWIGLVGNSRYYNYTLSVNGTAETHGDDAEKDYLTDIIARYAYRFLRHVTPSQQPFFMMMAPPAPHEPFIPSNHFLKNYSHMSAPRTPNFNVAGGKTKHWLLRQPPNPLSEALIKKIDKVFRNRLRTLLSVDKMIEMVHSLLKKYDLLKSTYIIFSSDNGFHLGQFSLPWDKRQLYEFDIRVPLIMSGPGIPSGLKLNQPVMNIDIAPTLLELAGLPVVQSMDGKSLVSLFHKSPLTWRTHFLVEHQGETSDHSPPGCPQYSQGGVHMCEPNCICEDAWNNTYHCMRTLSHVEESIFCVFDDNEGFIELYDLASDPYQLHNLPSSTDFLRKSQLNLLKTCSGIVCQYM